MKKNKKKNKKKHLNIFAKNDENCMYVEEILSEQRLLMETQKKSRQIQRLLNKLKLCYHLFSVNIYFSSLREDIKID